jgi:hypothetical protein
VFPDAFIFERIKMQANKETKKCYQLATGFGLVTENSGNLQLIRYTDIYMPARIGHGVDYSQFVADTKNTNPNMGFKQCHELHKIESDKMLNEVTRVAKYGHRPYGLMNEIPINNLRLWDENIKTYDNIPNNITKHKTLISKQFERKSEFYYNYKEDIGAWEDANTNPAWNVVCQKGTTGNFFQYVSGPMPEKYTTLCTIDDHLNPTIENTHLHNMHTMAQRPLFLVNPKNLSAKDFLCSIPHNLERIMKDLREGRKIVHIPYFTKLFIGYIINNIQTINSEDAMIEFFEDIAERCGAYCGGQGFDSPNYRVDNDCDAAEGKFVQLLLVLAGYFTTTNDDLMLTPSAWTTSFTSELAYSAQSHNALPSNIAIDIWDFKEKGLFKKDVFGFVDEFKKWSVSTSEGGLKWFANSMCLEMNPSVSVDGKKIFTLDSSDTQLNNVKKFLEIETVYKSLQNLSSQNANKPKVAASNTKNYVNL